MSGRKIFPMLVAAYLAMIAGCDTEGPAERAGEDIDQTMERTGEPAEQPGQPMQEPQQQ